MPQNFIEKENKLEVVFGKRELFCHCQDLKIVSFEEALETFPLLVGDFMEGDHFLPLSDNQSE
jgi:hypothetical protein